MSHVTVRYGLGQLDFYGHHALVPARNDEVYLVLTSMCPEVAHTGLGVLGIDADVQRDQRLKELTKKC